MIELGTIRKTARAEIRFTVENCQGLEIVTARAWYRDDAGANGPARMASHSAWIGWARCWAR